MPPRNSAVHVSGSRAARGRAGSAPPAPRRRRGATSMPVASKPQHDGDDRTLVPRSVLGPAERPHRVGDEVPVAAAARISRRAPSEYRRSVAPREASPAARPNSSAWRLPATTKIAPHEVTTQEPAREADAGGDAARRRRAARSPPAIASDVGDDDATQPHRVDAVSAGSRRRRRRTAPGASPRPARDRRREHGRERERGAHGQRARGDRSRAACGGAARSCSTVADVVEQVGRAREHAERGDRAARPRAPTAPIAEHPAGGGRRERAARSSPTAAGGMRAARRGRRRVAGRARRAPRCGCLGMRAQFGRADRDHRPQPRAGRVEGSSQDYTEKWGPLRDLR